MDLKKFTCKSLSVPGTGLEGFAFPARFAGNFIYTGNDIFFDNFGLSKKNLIVIIAALNI